MQFFVGKDEVEVFTEQIYGTPQLSEHKCLQNVVLVFSCWVVLQ